MTKYVYDNHGVAHAFASGTQDHARSHNGNFYFHGDTLFSYGSHYPVAHVDRENRIAYMNADPSSPTTEGKHKNAARRALSHFERIYLPQLDILTRHGFCKLTKNDLARYIQLIADDIKSLEDKRGRMRSEWRKTQNEHQQNELRHAAQIVWKLHKRRGDCFSVADRDTKKERDARWTRDLQKRFDHIKGRITDVLRVIAEVNDYECRADVHSYRMKLHVLRDTKLALYPSIGFGSIADNVSRKNAVRIMGAEWVKNAEKMRDEYYALAENQVEPEIDKAIEHFSTRLSEIVAEDVEAWVTGEKDHVPRDADMVLRIKDDELQTSQGARVPLRDAVILTHAAIKCRANGEGWKRNGERKRVGGFECDRITQNGDLIVGCHNIPWSAIVACVTRFAEVLPVSVVEGVK